MTSPQDWTPGPPTEEGSYWVFLPEYHSVEHAEVQDIFGRLRLELAGSETSLPTSDASHHISLTRPEPPALPTEYPR